MFNPYVLIPLLFLIGIGFLCFKRLLNSPKFEKWCKELETGEVIKKSPSSTEVINKIKKAEGGLADMADEKEKEAKKLQQESSKINKHLTGRGLSKKKKGDATE